MSPCKIFCSSKSDLSYNFITLCKSVFVQKYIREIFALLRFYSFVQILQLPGFRYFMGTFAFARRIFLKLLTQNFSEIIFKYMDLKKSNIRLDPDTGSGKFLLKYEKNS